MKKFFEEILKKLLVTILFAVLMFLASYCVMTGEFPPNITNMKKGVFNLQAQIKQINQLREAQLAKLSKMGGDETIEINSTPGSDPTVISLDQAELKYQQALLDKIKDLEARVSRLESQIQH